MNQQDFENNQRAKKVELVKPPPTQTPPPSYTLADLKKTIDLYQSMLEQMRTGRATAGKMSLGSGQSLGTSFSKLTLASSDVASFVTADTANNRLTVQSPGFYLITGTLNITSTADGTGYQAAIYLNGSASQTVATIAGAASLPISVPVSTILSLVGGDYLELYGKASTGSPTAASDSFLSIIKL